MTTFLCARRSITDSRPAHSASADLPVPARPPRETMPISGSSRRSSAMRCSAERPCRPNAWRSPRTSRTCLSGLPRPSAEPREESNTSPVCGDSSAAAGTNASPVSYRSSSSASSSESSAIPVKPASTASMTRYSSVSRPTAAAFTRSGTSLVMRQTSRPSDRRFSATTMIRLSLLSLRNPVGSTPGSLWLSSTCRVPPSSPIGTGASSRPCATRRSSSIRRACRANQPSSGWLRLSSSSPITTSGSTTSESPKRISAPGSESRTEVSRTYVRRLVTVDSRGAHGAPPLEGGRAPAQRPGAGLPGRRERQHQPGLPWTARAARHPLRTLGPATDRSVLTTPNGTQRSPDGVPDAPVPPAVARGRSAGLAPEPPGPEDPPEHREDHRQGGAPPGDGRAVATDEELPRALDDVLERVDVTERLQPARRQGHRQQDSREQQDGEHEGVEQRRERVLALQRQGECVGDRRERRTQQCDDQEGEDDPEHRGPQAQWDGDQYEQRALHQQDDDVAHDPPEQQRRPARRGHPLGFDDAGPVLGDQTETDEQGTEDGQLNQDPGNEDLVGVARPQLPGQRFEQRPEQHDVEDRLHHHDGQPGGVAQRHPQRTPEHRAGVAQQGPHQTVTPSATTVAGVPESRNERPVSPRKTSSRLGRRLSMPLTVMSARSSRRTSSTSAAAPCATRPTTRSSSAWGGSAPGSSPTSRVTSATWSRRCTVTVSTSPPTWDLSSSGVPLATIAPWSMTRIRSHSASASSR